MLFLLTPINLMAQEFEWVKRITREVNVSYHRLTTDSEGNVFVMGTFRGMLTIGDSTFNINSASGHEDNFLAKYSPAGQVLWAQHFGGYGSYPMVGEDFMGSITTDTEGNCYVSGSYNGLFKLNNIIYNNKDIHYDNQDSYLIKFDKNGKTAWIKFLEGKNYVSLKGLSVDGSGNIIMGGNLYLGNTLTIEGTSISPLPNQESYLVKFTRDGNLIWLKNVGGMNNLIITDKAGSIYLTGHLGAKAIFGNIILNETPPDGNIAPTSFIAKFDPNSNALWAKPLHGISSFISSRSINVDASGNIYLMGQYNSNIILGKDTLRNIDNTPYSNNSDNVFLARFSQQGNPLWAIRMVSTYSVDGGDILTSNTGGIYFSGNMSNRGLIGDTVFGEDNKGGMILGKIDGSGKVQWVEQITGSILGTYGFTMGTNGKGHLFLAGLGGEKFGAITDIGTWQSLFFTKVRDTTFVIPNKIRGKVYHDVNKNCLQDSGEEPLAYHLLKAEPGPYYASTDQDGNYLMELPKGIFSISQINDREGLIVGQHCPINNGAYSISFLSQSKDTSGFDFGNKVTRLPLLKVNVAADRLRRCFRSSTTVRYSNTGYASAHNVEVKVYYPSYVVPISATMAYSQKDSLLTFTIGTLQPGQSGSITIADSVICGNESIRGLTQCVKAVITPYNSKPVDSRWDGSDVELKAVCKENGLVRLSIYNSGRGNMADSAAYRIFLDAVNVFKANYMLQKGDSLTLQVPVNGCTLRLEADLRPYHPEKERKPSITLEGCGGGKGVTVSKGFMNMMPADDSMEEISLSCLPILDSYDPNDKAVTPEGVGPEKIVRKETPLEYLIRFQNTGTDIAYKVVVVDTLDATLDIASLDIGASSHPFTYSITGMGAPVLTWTFNNINLPDSTSNEPASHGYLRFRIRPKKDTPDGVKITNSAAIYFDYNSPVITNTVLSTTGQLPVDIHRALAVEPCKDNSPSMALAGEDRVIHESSLITLQANRPAKGYGYWKLISGKGTIVTPWDPQTEIRELGPGKNLFEWSVTLCDSVSRSRLTVEQVVIPPLPDVSVPSPFCNSEKKQQLHAKGSNIAWYVDASMQNKVADGESYQASFEKSDTIYVTQTIDGYQSLPALLPVVIKPLVGVPVVDGAGYLCNGMLLNSLKASGEGIRWYSDEKLTTVLQEGNVFDKTDLLLKQLFVTGTINGCTSEARQVELLSGAVDLKERVKIPNVITPNGDGANDAFLLPKFEENTCIGRFLSIRIYNRWGKVIFTSTDPAFSWDAKDQSAGIYFYEIRYTNFSAGGGLSVLY
ncbi:DUF7619 domain-containing protein [Rhodocytophaga aerolata]|uniref:DUF7619 domain-containing protein n=1 Tax=Rhodocytophaga aerolata TaxID=455078 RepID=UPI00366D8CAD